MSQQYPPYNNNQQWNNPQHPLYQQPQPYYPQQPIYQQPGQFVQPQAPKRTLRQRFKALPKKTRAGIGCASLLLILSLCICTAVVSTANSSSHTTQLASVTTPTLPPTTTHKATALSKPDPTAKPKPTLAPTAIPTQAPVPTQPPAPPAPTSPPVQTGVNGNPWGYNFTTGNLIYSPNAAFCDYFTCVSTFWKDTNGYVAECYNGSYTHSGGISGACSRDGSVKQPLYSH